MSTNLRYLFTLAVPVAAAVAGAAWMFGWGSSQPGGIVYETAEVSRGPIRRVVSTSGPVRALVTVAVGSQLSGQIQEVKADFNTEVKAGDEMAVLDDKTYQSRLLQARADLAAAQAQVTNQEATLVRAEAVERNAQRATVRQQTLASKGVSSSAALDTATRDADVARAEIAVARAQIANAQAVVAQRTAQLRQAEIDLERTRIRSPINGTVISRTVDIGQTVAASLQAPELFKIAQDLRRIRIEAQVNEADVGSVAEGNPVEFTVDAYPDRQFRGRVTQVRLAAVELNNVVTYTVIIEAQNDDRKLFPGMTANAQIESARKDDALRIPTDALRFRPRQGTTAAANPAQQSQQRSAQMIDRLKSELSLTQAQADQVRQSMQPVFAEMRPAGNGGAAGGFPGMPQAQTRGEGADTALAEQRRARISEALEKAIAAVVTEAQKPAFETWKASRGQRQQRSAQQRPVGIWVLKGEAEIEERQIRTGLADDQFTEVLGPALTAGDRVVIRAREVKR